MQITTQMIVMNN